MAALTLPKIIEPIFRGATVHPEGKLLPNESAMPKKKVGKELRMRALDNFAFVKDGKFVHPTSGQPQKSWEGVMVYGEVATLTGDGRFFIWAGQWKIDWRDKWFGPRGLKNVTDLYMGTHKYWRGEKEDILWLDTEYGSYALLEPAAQYDAADEWKASVESYKKVYATGRVRDPTFRQVTQYDERPLWWTKSGNEAWNKLTEEVRAEAEREKAEERERAKRKRDADRKKRRAAEKEDRKRKQSSAGGKSPNKPRASGAQAGGAGPSTGSKRKREADPATSEPDEPRKSQKTAMSVSSDDDEPTSPEASPAVEGGASSTAEPGRSAQSTAPAAPPPAQPAVPGAGATSDTPGASNEVTGDPPRGGAGSGEGGPVEGEGGAETAEAGREPPVAAVEEKQGSDREQAALAEEAKRSPMTSELAKQAGESGTVDGNVALEGSQPRVDSADDMECTVVAPSAASQLAKGLEDVSLGIVFSLIALRPVSSQLRHLGPFALAGVLSQQTAPASAEPEAAGHFSPRLGGLDVAMADVETASVAPALPAPLELIPAAIVPLPASVANPPATEGEIAPEGSRNNRGRAASTSLEEVASTPVGEFGRLLAEEGALLGPASPVPASPVPAPPMPAPPMPPLPTPAPPSPAPPTPAPSAPTLSAPASSAPAPPKPAPPVTSISALVHPAPSAPTAAVSSGGARTSTLSHSVRPVPTAESLDLDNRSSRLRRGAGGPAEPSA
ncbi:hypothetical protein FRC12_012982 [Ceratobasidium sp. 428]|nr:hypothetical protein FRC12_012982 [Ceratobasidium sp. 428]